MEAEFTSPTLQRRLKEALASGEPMPLWKQQQIQKIQNAYDAICVEIDKYPEQSIGTLGIRDSYRVFRLLEACEITRLMLEDDFTQKDVDETRLQLDLWINNASLIGLDYEIALTTLLERFLNEDESENPIPLLSAQATELYNRGLSVLFSMAQQHAARGMEVHMTRLVYHDDSYPRIPLPEEGIDSDVGNFMVVRLGIHLSEKPITALPEGFWDKTVSIEFLYRVDGNNDAYIGLRNPLSQTFEPLPEVFQ